MKKYILGMFILLMLFPVTVFASDIDFESIEVLEKSESAEITKDPVIKDNNIEYGVKFFYEDDYISYKLIIKNNTDEEYMLSNDLGEKNENFLYEIKSDKDIVEPNSSVEAIITLKYQKELTQDQYKKYKHETEHELFLLVNEKEKEIEITDDEPIENPQTGIVDYIIPISIVIVGGTLIIRYSNKKSKFKYMSLIAIVSLLTTTQIVKAINEIQLKMTGTIEVNLYDDRVKIDNMLPVPTSTSFFETDLDKATVEKIYTVKSEEVPTSAIKSWDISEAKNDSIHAWILDEDNNGLYELYLGQEKGVVANPNSKYLFYNFPNLELIDASSLIVNRVEDASHIFRENPKLKEINFYDWDTSKVTTFRSFLYNDYLLEKFDLSDFDTSSATDMGWFFYHTGDRTKKFYADVSNWDTSNVTNMKSMFSFETTGCTVEDWEVKGLENWNTSSVTDMSYMFYYTAYCAPKFEIDLTNWDVSSVTNMSCMFYSMYGDENLIKDWSIGDLSDWNVSNVTTMRAMFGCAARGAKTFIIGNLKNWNVSNVTDMYYLFSSTGVTAERWYVGELDNWDTSKVTDMSWMFQAAGENDRNWSIGNISKWDVSKVTNMDRMFSYAGAYATNWYIGDLDNWDVSSVTNMNQAFCGSGQFGETWSLGDLTNWDMRNVTTTRCMFQSAGKNVDHWTLGDLSKWKLDSATNYTNMFAMAGENAKTFELDLSTWNTSKSTSMGNFLASAGVNSTNYSVKIPKMNGNGLENTPTRLYGSTTSIYGFPATGKQFTIVE